MNLFGNKTHIVLNTMSKVMLFRLAAHIKVLGGVPCVLLVFRMMPAENPPRPVSSPTREAKTQDLGLCRC
ncbi:uncharacterized protein K441DRAFT_122938 [Cenococcum geophilum 1.58]|uniref:uncharacterized protein n=1 Tax=Cenococcum geophilum 1.58 TaxID=794803 RepID=UPI00358F0ED6|nr:hypothetical protein K441DRAFT_122938 [Cenococcum geophilum 1.58]